MTLFRRSMMVGALAATVLGLTACAAQAMKSEGSLYERLGGKPAINAVVDAFIANVAADGRINGRFANADIPRLKEKLAEQICAGTGGPCRYTGRDMKSAHAGMNISDAEFGALVEDLVKALDQFKVPSREKQELLTILGSMKADVVGASGGQALISYPHGYRGWYHVKSRINLEGHSLAANVGYQHIYANEKALAGLKSGSYADGAMFVLDRIGYAPANDNVLVEGERKVLAVMVKHETRYASTGGWGFEGFKNGDPTQRAVQDGGAKCFSCHAPLMKDNFVFTKLRD
jgi:hemoglobin